MRAAKREAPGKWHIRSGMQVYEKDRPSRGGALAWLWLACLALPALAAGTATWEINSFEEFLKGKFTGVALSRNGQLQLAPQEQLVFNTEQPVIWTAAAARDGTVYLGTGHRGRVYRAGPDGKSSLLWSAEEPEIFALTVDARDQLYVATSPNGRIYRWEGGQMVEYFNPGQTYIWSLTCGADGVLYAGTGEGGKVYRIAARNQGEVYYDSGQGHVTSLLLDREGRLLAGTEPNGLLYRITAKEKAFVLYDSNLPEIRSLAVNAQGDILAAALGGALARRIQAAAGAAPAPGATTPTTVTSITVTAEAQQGGVEIKPPEPAKPAAAPPGTAALSAAVISEISGVETSAIYQIRADGSVETLFSSKEENIYDISLDGENVLFSTDRMGRVFRWNKDRSLALLTQTNEGEVTRLMQTPAGLMAATGNMGKLVKLTETPAMKGEYESPVHDAGTVARWGKLQYRSDQCASCKLAFRTRSGNSATPDKTWSDWSAPASGDGSVPIASPPARYLQWKVELEGAGRQSPILDSVTAAYLPQNSRPVLNSITAALQLASKTPAATQSGAANAAYSITVTDSGSTGGSTSAGTPTQKLLRQTNDEIKISWEAEDYDGDRLQYALYFRGEAEQQWKLLKGELTEKNYALDAFSLADGKYYFKVVATDVLDNPRDKALSAELVSAAVLIDQTPPRVTISTLERQGERLRLRVTAEDTVSMVQRCESAVNAGPWEMLAAADGVADSRREEFGWTLTAAPGSEQVLVVRCRDAAENFGIAKVVLR